MRIAHLSNLSNAAFNNCCALRDRGVDAELYVTHHDVDSSGKPVVYATEDPRTVTGEKEWPEWVHSWRMRPPHRPFLEQRRILAGYDLVHAYTTTPVFAQFCGKIVISHCTGSDLRELAVSRSLRGALLRRAYRRSAAVLYTDCDTWTLAALERLALPNARFVNTIIDLDAFYPGVDTELRQRLLGSGEDFLIFAPARQDWRYKGNDVLIRAFARLCARRDDIRLVLRSYGEDGPRAEALAVLLGVSSRVTFVGELSPMDVARYCRAADAVAGFFVGKETGYPHFPLIIQEPLACAKPTVTYCDSALTAAMFGDDVPFILAQDPDSVDDRLEQALAGGTRVERIVANGLAWARLQLPAASIARDLIDLYEVVLRRARN